MRLARSGRLCSLALSSSKEMIYKVGGKGSST